MSSSFAEAYNEEMEKIASDLFFSELEKEGGLGSLFQRGLAAGKRGLATSRQALSTRRSKAAAGLALGATGVAGGVVAKRRGMFGGGSGGKVGTVPASAKSSSLYRRIVQKAIQRFTDIPRKTVEWLVFIAMRERGLVK